RPSLPAGTFLAQRDARSQAWCKQLMWSESKSSYYASRFLPSAKRRALEALYAVFRTADDLADEPGLELSERRQGLALVARDLENAADLSDESSAPWFPAVRAAFAAYPIARSDALGVITACLRELDGVRPSTISDLERHAASLTGGVARCGLAVLGADDPRSLALAERIGIAMQFTNILRDEKRDLEQGRDYLTFAGSDEGNRFAAKEEIAARARAHYRAGEALVASLPRDGSNVAVMLAIDLYRALLSKLERKRFASLGERARLGRVEVIWWAVRSNVAAFMR
ncbi:MAG TPA: squalene/phytoene synthase family protein, partial [Candidatus Acidoferrales bacterium]|nr:squalene/phytoene synthase family protein [Candidatus Acidoferrales bacterium]